MAAGREEHTRPEQVRATAEYYICELSVRSFKGLDRLESQRNFIFLKLAGNALADLGPSLHATTSAIQCFIIMASSAPLSPLPYAATGFPVYSKPSQ